MRSRIRCARGFTLVEMLVVVGIICLVVTLLLPAISSASKTSQRAVGVARMHAISQVLAAYGNENKGMWYNPIATCGLNGWGSSATKAFGSDGFMAYGSTFITAWANEQAGNPEPGFSPADGDLLGRYASQPAEGCRGRGNRGWPSSFYYSPTMYRDRTRFVTSEDSPFRPHCPPEMNPDVRLNFMQDVAYPSAKVVLYERADFLQPTRPRADPQRRSEALAPSFSSPRAKINAAVADGSTTLVDLQSLNMLADEAMRSGDWTYLPVDHLGIPDQMPELLPSPGNGGEDGVEGTTIDFDTPAKDAPWLYFFAGTRDGIRGRDLRR